MRTYRARGTGLPQAADGLRPAEDLLDALAFLLAERVTLMPGGAVVDRGATLGGFSIAGILRDVQGGAELAQLHSEMAEA